jgi:5-methylcytosine-specific restriction protein A
MSGGWPYTSSRWKRLRAMKLSIDPVCEDCAAIGRTTPADTVDHKIAISQGGEAFPEIEGLSSKCTPCHSRKTVRSAEAGAVRTDKPMKGCDADGLPLDPKHWWNA